MPAHAVNVALSGEHRGKRNRRRDPFSEHVCQAACLPACRRRSLASITEARINNDLVLIIGKNMEYAAGRA